MKINALIWLAALMLLLLKPAAALAGDTFITFSVDMSNYSYSPGVDTIEVHGTFNSWAALNLVQVGSSTVYTNTIEDTVDDNGGKMEYKFVINGGNWENPASGCNRAVLLPATNGASLVLPTAYFSDSGPWSGYTVTFQVDMTQQIALGNFIPGTSWVEVRGSGLPNGWNGDTLTPNPSILRTNSFGMVTSNVWTGTFSVTGSPGGADQFKYYIQPAGIWENPGAVNRDCNGNRYLANADQTLPVVDFNDAPSTLVTFNVDMSAVAATDTNFNPDSVTLNGDFNNWGGGIAMTNNPAAPNTNLFSTVIPLGVGTTVNYQFRYVELNNNQTVYDLYHGILNGASNRSFTVPNAASANVPAVLFNDAPLSDYLTQPTLVTFSVDMNGAIGTDGHAFDPGSGDAVFVYGEINTWYSWYPWANSVNIAPYRLIQQGSSTIYTNTILLPAGTMMAFQYKYGILRWDLFSNSPSDDEAPFGQNHYRVIRSTAHQPYVMPLDTFGVQYGEPFFDTNSAAGSQLSIGPESGGTVPVTWLGRPGAHLQYTTNLLTGAWQDLTDTDGTNWTAGYSSTNGFVSRTNWPANGAAYFRIVKP